MPEWWIERGIGETRFALIDGGDIVEARIELEGLARAGTVIRARLVDSGTGGRNAVARDESGAEFLLPRGAAGVTQGSVVAIEVTREGIPGAEPWKRPLARVGGAPGDAERVAGCDVSFPGRRDVLTRAGWDDLSDEARSGIVRFAGGELRISPTPAMTLIDVDGYLPSDELAVRGAAEAAKAIRRLDIGGSVGIDLPSAGSRAARQAAAAAIDAHLPQPFERTAVNGFGFVQIVRRRVRASLVELAQDRAPFEARALLRRTSLERAGATRLAAHPSVIAAIERAENWTERLSRQLGGAVTLRADRSLAISGGYAETP
ncbi:ribonuclease [Sphingomonas sp.]|uniref:ribonuclease n=1 Tax=Sphingomonas sp. TaxID=28214 RepID=UPI0025FC1456|nr:ribonuclease [Sphingomonas sp.]MBV9528644.1 ribonuclease [Sphingomonas sp.]